MSVQLVDAHLHLPTAGEVGEGVFLSMGQERNARLFVNSVNEEEWQEVLILRYRYPTVTPFLGIHPWWAAGAREGWQERLALAVRGVRAGLGEIGLDALAVASTQCQEAVFIDQLALAEGMGLPVAIHCCRRWGRLLEIMSSILAGRARVIIHGFSGSQEVMWRLLNLGVMLSFGSALLNPERRKVREAFEKVPIDRLLLESDWSPRQQAAAGLSPPKEPGTTLVTIYHAAAVLRGIDEESLRAQLWCNAQNLLP